MNYISQNSPKVKKLQELSSYLFQLTNQGQLFEMSKNEKADRDKKVKDLVDKIEKLETEIESIKTKKIHRRLRLTEAYRIVFMPQIPGQIRKYFIDTD